MFEVKSALGQISGCLDTAWTVLGHVLGQTWFGFLGCPEAARRVLGSNRGEGKALLDAARKVLGSNGGEREALLDAFPRVYCDEQIQGENPCQSDSVRHEFLLEFVYHCFTAAGMRLLGDLPSSDIIVNASLSLLGLLVGLCCSSWGPVSRLARLASLGSLFGLCCWVGART